MTVKELIDVTDEDTFVYFVYEDNQGIEHYLNNDIYPKKLFELQYLSLRPIETKYVKKIQSSYHDTFLQSIMKVVYEN